MSAMRADWREVPLPERMARLDKDKRGLPIPFLVLRDPGTGKPNFTINDHRKHQRCLKEDLCAICGEGLTRGRWFIGGPGAAFHDRGCYLDPPVHGPCAHYALQVCPYLAAPKYSGRLDDLGFDWSEHPDSMMLIDKTSLPDRPEIFVAVMAVGQSLVGDALNPYVKPKRPYRQVEFWRQGVQIEKSEGEALVKSALASLAEKEAADQREPPRLIQRPEASA